MTKEEIIEEVKAAFDIWESEYDTGNDWSKAHKARDMAIKAIEQEPCEDAVSRKSALLRIREFIDNTTYTEIMMLNDIKNLPPVTPIRPKGHWIDHSDEGYVECPKCGSATNCDDNIADLHFCFSCGAEMEGSEEV